MKEISFDEAKKVSLKILIDIAKFCDEHDLTYFLGYGTLIGAVRHKGFIPWDDDIDITMPRKDYNEFIRSYNADGNRYRVIAPSDKSSRHSYAKVIDTHTVKIEPMLAYDYPLGIDVDIFPMDGMPDTEDTYNAWYDSLLKLYRQHDFAVATPNSNDWWKNLKLCIHKIGIPKRAKILEKAAALHSLYPYDECSFVGTIECQWNWRGNRSEKTAYNGTIDLEFEGLYFKAPIGYDTVLRNIYGDYMQLPPEEKRVTHHINKTYWKDGYEEN